MGRSALTHLRDNQVGSHEHRTKNAQSERVTSDSTEWAVTEARRVDQIAQGEYRVRLREARKNLLESLTFEFEGMGSAETPREQEEWLGEHGAGPEMCLPGLCSTGRSLRWGWPPGQPAGA